MAIRPECDTCGEELTKFGAILFSPPDEESRTLKLHICVECYKEILKKFKYKPSSPGDKKVLK
ncbi:MAG: hypothetical protein H6799_03185 [Candidatus Nomurabacteria bacterium]|nr:MAG: hypothetical protein H6799_03185 [Candidatus Nomurabacteria bacterium]HRV75804.1 hypothetical protein [Candidatus Saccharimonadales bacterium]